MYPLRDYIKYLDKLKKEDIIDGIEVYHSSFSKEEMSMLEKYCKENNLYMSGGSDCHGNKKIDRKIGVGYNNLNIDDEVIKDWYKSS